MDLISIIVPVYKVEKYLSECIDSILAQTYENFELILVDDGSPDNSGKICDEYAQKDKRIKVIHKENAGVSSARNTGLDNANGDYITFIDSDDFVDKRYLDVLYNNLKQNDSDISCVSFYYDYESNIQKNQDYSYCCLNIDFKDKDFVKFFKSFFQPMPPPSAVWCKLFSKNVIRNIRFKEKIRIAEDKLFFLTAFRFSNRICFSNECVYFYKIRQGTAFNSYKTKFIENQWEYYTELCDLFSKLKIFDSYGYLLDNYVAVLVNSLFANELRYRNKNTNYKSNIQEIKNHKIYKKYKLFKGLKTGSCKFKLKFLLIWVVIKFKLY